MIRYKLTTQDMKTRKGKFNEVTWKVGEWVKATGKRGNGLCSDEYIHWYTSPLLALLMNQNDADIKNPRLWKAEIAGRERTHRGLKGGSRKARLIRELPIPRITLEHRARFAILVAKEICADAKWNAWADAWLNGKNRRKAAIVAVRNHIFLMPRTDLSPTASQAANYACSATDPSYRPRERASLAASTAYIVANATKYSRHRIDFAKIARKAVYKD